jgi:hypothetical protein
LNYAGQVAVNGEAFDGSGQFKFALVNTDGTTTYWSNDGKSVNGSEPQGSIQVPVNGGLYSILLGNTAIQGMNALDPTIFQQYSDVKLRVWFSDGVNGFQQLSPDRPFASVPYAFSAGSAPIADGSIEHSMLSNALRSDLNSSIKNITRNMLPPSVLEDLNRTITKSNLGTDVLSDLNASITLDRLSQEVLSALQISPTISTQTFASYDPLTKTARIEALARGHNLSYQWLKNGEAIAGANTPILELNNPLLDDNATYALLVSNSIGQTTSNTLTLRQAVGIPPVEAPELGLIGHWTFDEGIGAQAHDTSGNRRHATLTNMDESAAWVSGALGTAVHFDGTNDNLAIPIINGEIKTLALWLQPDPGTGVRPVISVGNMSRIRLNDPLGSVGLMIDQNTSTFAQSSSTGNLVSSDWVHLAFRWNGGTNSYQILIDGVAKSTTAGSTRHVPLRQGVNLFVSDDNGSRYSGKMDDLRIYSRSLSNLEIQALCDQDGDGLNAPRELLAGTNPNNPDSDGDGETDLEEIISGSSPQDVNETAMTLALKNGLLAYLPFDETNGTQFPMDVSGNNRYATLLGFESNQSIWEPGKIGNAIRFDGVNDYATIPANLGINFTVSLWIKTTSNLGSSDSSDWNGPLGLVVGPTDKHALMLAGGKFRLWSGNLPNGCRISSYTKANHGAWIHLGASRSDHNHQANGTLKIYINGNLDQSVVKNDTKKSTGSILHLGKTPSGSKYYEGLMDELYVYNRTLFGSEIKSLYDRGLWGTTFSSYGFESNSSDSNATLAFQDALIANITFDETNGTQFAQDASGNNRYATLLGFESNQSIWEPGKIGNAIRFDGVNDYATIPANLGINFTVSLWIKTLSDDGNNSTADWNSPIGLVAGPTDKHALMLAGGKFRLWSGNLPNGCRISSYTKANHGAWIHLGASRSDHNHQANGTLKIYINGNLDQSVVKMIQKKAQVRYYI